MVEVSKTHLSIVIPIPHSPENLIYIFLRFDFSQFLNQFAKTSHDYYYAHFRSFWQIQKIICSFRLPFSDSTTPVFCHGILPS